MGAHCTHRGWASDQASTVLLELSLGSYDVLWADGQTNLTVSVIHLHDYRIDDRADIWLRALVSHSARREVRVFDERVERETQVDEGPECHVTFHAPPD
jgi:hypothetical protein